MFLTNGLPSNLVPTKNTWSGRDPEIILNDILEVSVLGTLSVILLAVMLSTTPLYKSARSTATNASACILTVEVFLKMISLKVVSLIHFKSFGAHG